MPQINSFNQTASSGFQVTNSRRLFLKKTLSTSAVALAVGSGLLIPMQALAWNKAAFTATNLQTAIKSALGSDLSEASNKITIDVPEIVENGAVIPITVSSSLKEVSTISLFSEKNSVPLVAQFELDKDCQAFIATRIKMSSTSNVIAIVTAGGKNYNARKEVKMTIGGCSD